MALLETFMASRTRRGATVTLTLLRVVLGVSFVWHGWQKLNDGPAAIAAFAQLGIPAPETSVYVAIFAELLGGLGLVLGMLTPLAALGPMLTTLYAAWFARPVRLLFPEHVGWEYPLLVSALCLHFAVRGGGAYSVDALMAPRPSRFRRRHRHVAATT